MMAQTLATPSVDSKDAAGEQKCDSGDKKSFRPELKEKRSDTAKLGGEIQNILKPQFDQSDLLGWV